MERMNLIVVSPLKGVLRPNRKIVLTRKFVDGMTLYRELWKGPLTLACEPAEEASDNLDNIEVDLDTAPFQTVCTKLTDERLAQIFGPNSLVLASAGFTNVSLLCRKAGIPCVYITECSLRTRLQMLKEYQPTPLHGFWRSWRERNQERAQVRAISVANAVQCNGTPTYFAYKSLTPLPHLFFDTRIEESMLADQNSLLARLARLTSERVLHLVFSGRLKLIKGVDDLPAVASHLSRLGIPFKMSICGDGECMSQLRSEVAKLGLGDRVEFRGTLDFKTELVPFITNEADLFVCCHRQGDPSCTYLETMACGVPIVGYGNEALEGLTQVSSTGWIVPVGRPVELAQRIAALYLDSKALADAARRALAFARDHTFEKTFHRRIDHLERVALSALASSTIDRRRAPQDPALSLGC